MVAVYNAPVKKLDAIWNETVRKFLRFDELFIGMAELVDLDMFVAKALHHANAAQRILQTRVQTRHAHTILAEDYALAVVLDKRIRCHDSRHRQHHQCKRNIDEHQQREGTHDFQGCDKEVLGTVVGHLRNVKQIGNQLRHHFAGVIAVVIRKAQTLILLEQIHAHPRLHACTHNVAPARNEVLAQAAHHIHRHQPSSHPRQYAHNGIASIDEEIAHKEIEDLGECQVDGGEQRCAYQVGNEQKREWFVVANEFSRHFLKGNLPLFRLAQNLIPFHSRQ